MRSRQLIVTTTTGAPVVCEHRLAALEAHRPAVDGDEQSRPVLGHQIDHRSRSASSAGSEAASRTARSAQSALRPCRSASERA